MFKFEKDGMMRTTFKCFMLVLLFVMAVPVPAAADWQKIRDNVTDVLLARDQIEGVNRVFVVDRNSGDVLAFDGMNRWRRVGGPGEQFVTARSTAGTTVYGLTPGKDAVYQYLGKAGWKKIGGPGSSLYGGAGGLYALNPMGSELRSYDPGTGKWMKIGGAGKAFSAGTGTELFGISPNGNDVYRYTGTPEKWQRIWDRANAIYAAPGHLYATDMSGDLFRYDNKPFAWTRIGGPGLQFAATGDGTIYSVSPDGKGVYQYLGRPGQWQRIGEEARAVYALKDEVYILKDDGTLWIKRQPVTAKNADLLIIANDDSLAAALKAFVDYKQQHGYAVAVVTLDRVYRMAGGIDAAEKIRNYLIDTYKGGRLHYVLLVGDVDRIPMKLFFRENGAARNNAYLTDFYYADLHTSDWDLDDDGRWGEIPGEIKMKHDIVVSRIPFNDAASVKLVAGNMIDFQKDEGAPWQHRVILAHGFMNKSKDLAKDSEQIDSDILKPKGFTTEKLYVNGGKTKSKYFDTASATALGNTSYFNALKPNGQGMTLLSAHGTTNSMSSWYINADGNEDSIAFGSYDILKNKDVSGIFLLNGCNTAPTIANYPSLDAELNSDLSRWSSIGKKVHGNIGKLYLKRGAAVVIASTAGSDSGSQVLEYEFVHQLINQKATVGDAFVRAKEKAGNQRDYHVFYLMGDPTLTLQ